MTFAQDLLTRIVNISFTPGAIVVFMEGSYREPQLEATYAPIEGKAEFLSTWHTPTFSRDSAPLKNSAYRVLPAAGEFMTTTAPAIPVGDDRNGSFINAMVFAIDGGIGPSLDRAIEGTRQIAPALYLINVPDADLPSDVAPPGLLWSVVTGDMAGGVTMTWKIRYGPHREPESPTPPPNNMVQCYPLGPSHAGYVGDIKVGYSGYFLNSYRLDSKGTGTVYAKVPKVTDTDRTHNIPPEWSVPVATGPYTIVGIPFADPPPLITDDLE